MWNYKVRQSDGIASFLSSGTLFYTSHDRKRGKVYYIDIGVYLKTLGQLLLLHLSIGSTARSTRAAKVDPPSPLSSS